MDQDKTDPAQRPQTLLEAAKALVALKGWTEQFNEMRHLCAAIAREEKMPGESAAYWQALCDTRKVAMEKAMDRAQQAESTAAWHKAESGRLSAELALARNQLTLAVERSERLSEQLAGCHYDLGEANKQRQRAEKAESECREQRARAEAENDRSRDLSEKLIAAHGRTHAESERAKKAEAELARLGQQLARLCELQANPPVIVTQPFEGDPQTCAFGSNAFRGHREVAESDDDDDDPVDPTTGFTFSTYRRLLEALGGKS